MKLITLVIIGVFTITSAIRVPPSWPKKQNAKQINDKFRTTEGSEIAFRPHAVSAPKHNKINSGRKYVPYNMRHPNLKSQQKNEFKASATTDEWKPVFPFYRDDEFYSSFKTPSFHGYQARSPKKHGNPLFKNYRDDKTHEPYYETVREERIRKEKPLSQHEVPTKPIYPGQGQWAKRGQTHKPFISKHEFTPSEEDDEENPEGYEVFENNQKLFEKKQNDFKENIQEFPHKHNLSSRIEEEEEEEEEDLTEEEEDDTQEFVPTKIYTQVRRSETESHQPPLVEDPRLREVIKDSKIQTVYTEEGYEDLAYDHAGHEKNAEESEGQSEFDKEIEKERQRKIRKEVEEEDSEAAGSQLKNNFIRSKETKTMSVKNQNDGRTHLEVSNEIKILATPVNGSKTQRYVKIFPKVYRYDKIPEETTTSVPMESAIKSDHKRHKRFTNDFSEITVDTDFIDKIKHDLPKPTKVQRKPKYPYYNDPMIHPDSPLRYAEDLANIPKKTEDDLAFYNQADKIQCEEVQSTVDPIPERVKNADANPEEIEDSTDVQELVRGPRLKNLGDRIDCFKVKYFGEDPLDSPIFKESIGPVTSIFDLFKTNGKRDAILPIDVRKETLKISPALKKVVKLSKENANQLGLNILSDVVGQLKETEATTQPPLNIEIINTTTPEARTEDDGVISIITTPKYTIDLKPKHIYHQIQLLEYLPPYDTPSKNLTSNSTSSPESERQSKSLQEETTTLAADTPETLALRKRRRRIRPRPPFYNIFDVNRYLPTSPYVVLNQIHRTSTPRYDSLSEVHYKEEIKPSEQLNVFADVINNIKNSSKDPLQMASSFDSFAIDNILGNYKRKIPYHVKISEQSSLDNIEETNSFYLTTIPTTTVAPRGTIKYASYKTKEDMYEDMFGRDWAKYQDLELLKIKRKGSTTTTTTTTTTTEPYVSDKQNEEIEETRTVLGLMPPGLHRYKTIYSPKVTVPLQKIQQSVEETRTNNFFVLGMKPPSPKQKALLYSDFKLRPAAKKNFYLRRGKRGAQRPAYSEVVRNRNKPIDVEDDAEAEVVINDEEDDDYVPHRPKNYHYDEKTGRIVYDKVEKPAEEPEEEYIEITEAPIPKPTRRNAVTTPKFENFTGPSYIDFIKKLKNDPKYQTITDPPTTEKGKEEETTVATTTKPASTTPPEFLSILSKVRQDSGYKAITDATTTKKTASTTTEAAQIEEDEETQLENVQNSPGGQGNGNGQNFQIFDISEYLPKVKSYSPRTSIDYSKYKTIERPSVSLRHNLSSRYNSEEEQLEDVRTSRVPVLLEENKQRVVDREINPVVSESKREEMEPLTTTTTEATTTKRVRSPSRRRGSSRRPKQRSSPTPSAATEIESASHDKPKRTYPRRQRTRIKITSTTERPEVRSEETTKILRRRHQRDEDAPKETEKTNGTSATAKKVDDVQVFRNYEQGEKHGGNYKESDSVKNETVKRLTDVVVKPSAYYTDAKLPKKVNQLKEVEAEEDAEHSAEGTESPPDYDYEGDEDKTTTTKKPVFVKDPSKRLYYYAPI